VLALIPTTAESASALQRAGAIAAIVGASVAVLLLLAGVVRWWWRHHRVRSVKPRIHQSGENLYLTVSGLPASTRDVTAFVSDGEKTKKLGPATYRRDIKEDHDFNLRDGQPALDESVTKYEVEIGIVSDRGDHRRVFKNSALAELRHGQRNVGVEALKRLLRHG